MVVKKTYQHIFAVLFLTILSMPLICTVLSSLTEVTMDIPLAGYFDPVERPAITLQNFRSSEFQDKYTAYFHSTFAPRGAIIKSYNQFRYSLFHLGNNVIGADGSIWDAGYISEHYCIGEAYDYSFPENDQAMAEYARKLSVISDLLAARGKYLLVFTATSKADFMQEGIPAKYQIQANSSGVTASDCFHHYMKEYPNVVYLDVEEFINSLDLEYPSYYKSGIHWSRPAEQQVERELLRIIREEFGLDAGICELSSIHAQNEPFFRDADVYDLLNIYQKPNETYYEYEVDFTPGATPVNIMIQGDSYCSAFETDLPAMGYNGSVSFVFYMDIYHHHGTGIALKNDKSLLDLDAMVAENDVFIIGYTKPNLPRYGCGYVDALYDYLMENQTAVQILSTDEALKSEYQTGNVGPLSEYLFKLYHPGRDPQDYVVKCYTHILMRSPSEDEIQWWLTYFQQGHSEQDIITTFLHLDEFVRNIK